MLPAQGPNSLGAARFWPTRGIGLALLVLLSARPLCAQAFLDEMPAPERVLADIRGTDDVDTAARRWGGLNFLQAMLQDRYPGPGGFTARVRETYDRYDAAKMALVRRAHRDDGRDCRDQNCPGWRFGRLVQTDYSSGGGIGPFQQGILDRYFSPAWQAEYIDTTRPTGPRVRPVSPNAAPSSSSRSVAREAYDANFTAQLIAVAGAWGAIFLVGFVGAFRHSGLDRDDVTKLSVGFRHYRVHSVTGVVTSPSTRSETRTHVSGPADNVSSWNETHLHEQFFLVHPEGELRVQVVDKNVAVREGHRLSVAWAIRNGREQGPFVLFRNHSMDEIMVVNHPLFKILKPSLWSLGLPLLGVWIAALTTLPGGGSFDERSSNSALGPIAVALTIWAAPVWFLMRAFVGRRRLRRFTKNDARRLVAVLDGRASQPAGAVRASQS